MNPMSNAPEGFADTLYGYPTFYPIGGDGKPTGQPWLLYDGQSFPSVKAINAYKAALAARDENYEPPVAPVYSGPLDVASLSEVDWRVFAQNPSLWNKSSEIFSSSPVGKGPQLVGDLAQTVFLNEYEGVLKPYL